jgi:hypothetical protein
MHQIHIQTEKVLHIRSNETLDLIKKIHTPQKTHRSNKSSPYRTRYTNKFTRSGHYRPISSRGGPIEMVNVGATMVGEGGRRPQVCLLSTRLPGVGLGQEKGGSLASTLCKEKQRAAMATLGEFVFWTSPIFSN